MLHSVQGSTKYNLQLLIANSKQLSPPSLANYLLSYIEFGTLNSQKKYIIYRIPHSVGLKYPSMIFFFSDCNDKISHEQKELFLKYLSTNYTEYFSPKSRSGQPFNNSKYDKITLQPIIHSDYSFSPPIFLINCATRE
jgi:hypothetical protein